MTQNIDRPAPRRSWRFTLGTLLVLVLGVGLGVRGTRERLDARAELAQENAADTRLTVAAITVTQNSAPEELRLPASAEPWTDAPIYARTSGYVKRWLADLGTVVKRDQLLAELDTPEVDQQLRQAQANETTAAADAALAQRTAARYRELLATHFVSKQVADEKIAEAESRNAVLEAARANVRRLQELAGFKLIRAPFDGVVAERKVDIGDLVNASGSSATQLFRLTDVDRLRVFVRVPQVYAGLTTQGVEAHVHFANGAAEGVASRVVRTANVIDPVSRTRLCELELDNHAHALLAGAYVEVLFKLASPPATVKLPAAALMFRPEGVRVATVDDQGIVRLRPIAIGRDYGAEVEVLSGLDTGARVVVNPPDALADGQAVVVVDKKAPKP